MAKTVELIPVDDQGNEIALTPEAPAKSSTFAGNNPTGYALAMTGLDMIPMAASALRQSKVGIPVAGGLNVLGQAVKREINDEPQSFGQSAVDFGVGAFGQGVGDLFGKRIIPAISSLIPESWPKAIYKQAVKPSTTKFTLAERNAMADRGLKEGITLDEAGWEKLLANLRADKSIVEKITKAAGARGEGISPQSVINEFNMGGDKSMNSLQQLLDIDNPEVVAMIRDRANLLRQHGPLIKSDKAQGIKEYYQNQANYPNKDMRGDYTEQLDQVTARGFRKSLEAKHGGPNGELALANARNSERAQLAQQLNEGGTLGRIDNRDFMGLPLTVAAAAPGATQTAIGAATLAARTFGNFPKLTAKTAIKLYEAQTGVRLPVSKWREAAKYLTEAAVLGIGNETFNPTDKFNNLDPLGLRNAE